MIFVRPVNLVDVKIGDRKLEPRRSVVGKSDEPTEEIRRNLNFAVVSPPPPSLLPGVHPRSAEREKRPNLGVGWGGGSKQAKEKG